MHVILLSYNGLLFVKKPVNITVTYYGKYRYSSGLRFATLDAGKICEKIIGIQKALNVLLNMLYSQSRRKTGKVAVSMLRKLRIGFGKLTSSFRT